MLEKPPSLVIFDCDGVLVDSEELASRAFAEALLEIGLSLTAAELDRRFRGRSLRDCLALVERQWGVLPQEFAQNLNQRTFAHFESGLQAIPEIRSVLQALDREGVPYCVASSGSHEKMRFTLSLTGLLPYFTGRLFSADQVTEGKPAPDLFLFAAQQMRVNIQESVVIEDSLPGVEAGGAAGAIVFGYCPQTHPEQQRHHDDLIARGAVPFTSMNQLPDLFRL